MLDKSKLFGCSPVEVDDSLPRIWIILIGEGTSIIHSDNNRPGLDVVPRQLIFQWSADNLKGKLTYVVNETGGLLR